VAIRARSRTCGRSPRYIRDRDSGDGDDVGAPAKDGLESWLYDPGVPPAHRAAGPGAGRAGHRLVRHVAGGRAAERQRQSPVLDSPKSTPRGDHTLLDGRQGIAQSTFCARSSRRDRASPTRASFLDGCPLRLVRSPPRRRPPPALGHAVGAGPDRSPTPDRTVTSAPACWRSPLRPPHRRPARPGRCPRRRPPAHRGGPAGPPSARRRCRWCSRPARVGWCATCAQLPDAAAGHTRCWPRWRPPPSTPPARSSRTAVRLERPS
jgi:hypothetical protein